VSAPLQWLEIDAAAEAGVRTTQPEGIGRVVSLDGLVCWNNLGRNVVFADPELRTRAIFGSTLFPGEDDPAQFDLDIHAVLDVPELAAVVVLNHIGVARGFRRADLLDGAGARLVEPTALWSFVADVERTVVAAGRLIGSRPRSEQAPGVLVSAPLRSLPDHGDIPVQVSGEECGEVTALGVVPSPAGPLIAIGGDGRLSLSPLRGERLGAPQWEVDVEFRVACIAWDRGRLWAAGPDRDPAIDDYDWERLSGGGFGAFDSLDGTLLTGAPLPSGVAWGTGGVAVVPVGDRLGAVDRTGRLHLVDPRGGTTARTGPIAEKSLGIAHAAAFGERVVCGFNRGGYRLHAQAQAPDGAST
jgi:hypothetical protein